MSAIPLLLPSIPSASTLPIADGCSSASSDPLHIGLKSLDCGSFQGPSALESEVLDFKMEQVMVCPVNTVAHVPRSVHSLLAQVLSIVLCKACSSVYVFFVLVGLQNYFYACHLLTVVNTTVLLSVLFYLTIFIFGASLVESVTFGSLCRMIFEFVNAKDSLVVHFVSLVPSFGSGRVDMYSNVFQALSSPGVTGYDDDSTYKDLLDRHPSSPCPGVGEKSNVPSLTVDESMVLTCLQAFSKGTSPGASKLHAQHLLDAIVGSTAPAACDCLLF